ncbi:MAG: DUF45 domain-containing protein [Kiritimatiellae bacterium]|nr:DUF45 domain-containing protein [Kiritimatiellia bacterium]
MNASAGQFNAAVPYPRLSLFGKVYEVDYIPSRRAKSAAVGADRIAVLFPPAAPPEAWKSFLARFYKEQLDAVLPAMLATWSVQLGVNPSGYAVKRMHTRWGTCNPHTRQIWFSLMLADVALPLVEYIVAHELCHLLEASHNARFKFLMTNAMRDWRTRVQELNHPAVRLDVYTAASL